MSPLIRERMVAFIAILGLAGFLAFKGDQVDQLREAERQAVHAYRGARAQTDGAFRLIETIRDSLQRQGRRVDTVVRAVGGIADTLRLVVAASPSPDSVTLPKVTVVAWADKIDHAVNEVSKYRKDVDRLTATIADTVKFVITAERKAADSLLAIKDLRIKAERKQGRKEGAVGVLVIAAGWILFR